MKVYIIKMGIAIPKKGRKVEVMTASTTACTRRVSACELGKREKTHSHKGDSQFIPPSPDILLSIL
jgi:hypothetical protein